MKLSEWCEGKWPEIISKLLGQEWIDGRHHCCPKTGEGSDRFRFSDVNGRGNFFCGCSQGEKDGFELLQCVKGWDFPTAAAEVQKVVGQCPKDEQPDQPKKKSVVERLSGQLVHSHRSKYLENRGLEVPPGLKFHKGLPYFNDAGQKVATWPAMVGEIKRDGKVLTYHATWLMPSGEKIRKILPSQTSLQGGCVELYPVTDGVVGVAEGIETAIAAKMLFSVPVWSVVNTALMKSWKPPQNVKQVVIFGDNDDNYAGQASAFALAHRLNMQGFNVSLKFPPKSGQDFNDVLLDGMNKDDV